MLFDLFKATLPVPQLPDGFHFLEWHPSLMERHAKLKYLSFCNEIDARIFPSFRQYESCLRLMRSIVGKTGFLPSATWLMVKGPPLTDVKDCATIQGIKHDARLGAIQNVAVLPEFRCRGLGHALVVQSLHGFHRSGVEKVSLEVTAENASAIRLYEKIGFKIAKTVYKETVQK